MKAFAKKRSLPRKILLAFLILFAAGVLTVLFTNLFVIFRGMPHVRGPEDDPPSGARPDAIFVLGAFVRADGNLSDALAERVNTAVRLYRDGLADRILLSGDGANEGYNEPEAMKRVCLEQGVPESAILCDPGGLSTFESMKRAKEEYGLSSVLIVTQKYHLYRSVCFAEHFGLEAEGVYCDTRKLRTMNYVREIASRFVGFFRMIFE
ncbi:MAG: YdcF family protein [Clostridia bacterium]|nr:YdcF family protein [Clostridia bacterium]